MRSIGKGKITVEFFSTDIEFRVFKTKFVKKMKKNFSIYKSQMFQFSTDLKIFQLQS